MYVLSNSARLSWDTDYVTCTVATGRSHDPSGCHGYWSHDHPVVVDTGHMTCPVATDTGHMTCPVTTDTSNMTHPPVLQVPQGTAGHRVPGGLLPGRDFFESRDGGGGRGGGGGGGLIAGLHLVLFGRLNISTDFKISVNPSRIFIKRSSLNGHTTAIM